MNNDLNTWLEKDEPKLVNTIIADIKNILKSIDFLKEEIYGFSILPGDYCTMPNPSSIGAVYNRETDIIEENKDDIYYRYSVNEWGNFIHEGFDHTAPLKERDT